MQILLIVLSFILIVVVSIYFDLEPLGFFLGAVFGSGFTIASYYIEKRKERV